MNINLSKKSKIIIGLIASLICLGFQALVYEASRFIIDVFNMKIYIPKIDSIDNYIPLITIFIIPYIYSYIYWIIAPAIAINVDMKHFLNIIFSYIMTNIIGFIIFVSYPTMINRSLEGFYPNEINNVLDWLLKLIYDSDGKYYGYCLFPSMHCMTTTICFFATFRKNEINLGFRVFEFIMAILIFLSTVFIKQHYIADMIFGILIASIVWLIINKFNFGYKLFIRPINYFINKFKKNV